MKLYLLTQDKNRDYDTYDSAIVAANSEEEARMIHPCEYKDNMVWNESTSEWGYKSVLDGKFFGDRSWTSVLNVKVTYIGEAKEGTEKGVILSSFNAG